MRHLFRFLSTFGSAHPEFGPTGRQKSDISPSFCLLLVPRAPNFDKLVDKNEAFIPFFVYFRFRTAEFGIDGRQKSDISPSFCLLSDPRAKAGFWEKPRSTKLLKGRLRLRAKCHFLRFARKCRERRLNHKDSVDSRGIKSSFAAVSSAFSKKIGCMKYADGGSLRF